MGRIPRAVRRRPKESAAFTALSAVSGLVAWWGVFFDDNLGRSLLFAFGHFRVFWYVDEPLPAKPSEIVAIPFVIFVLIVGICVYVVAKNIFTFRQPDLRIELVAPCGQFFQGDTYGLLGLIRITNVGNQELTVYDVVAKTEWGPLHYSVVDEQNYFSQHLNVPRLADGGFKLPEMGKSGNAVLRRFVFTQSVAGVGDDSISPAGKQLTMSTSNGVMDFGIYGNVEFIWAIPRPSVIH
jgi:hypothetical protein